MAPVAVFCDKPAGNTPAEIDHVSGRTPPVAGQLIVMAAPTSRLLLVAGAQVTADRNGATVLLRAAVTVCGVEALSVTDTV